MEARFIEPQPSGSAPMPPVPLQSVSRLIAGLFFTVAGVLLTADNLDLLESERYLRFWPGLLVLLGVLKLFDGRSSRLVGGAFIISGTWLLAKSLDIISFGLHDLWPLLMIGGGVVLLLRAFGLKSSGNYLQRTGADVALFANRKSVQTTPDFRGGNLVALLGSHELDLSGADITTAPAVLDAFTFWGSIEVIVPDDWEIVSEVTPVMAGFEARSGVNADPRKRLIVRGAAIMAGIDVRNVSRRKR